MKDNTEYNRKLYKRIREDINLVEFLSKLGFKGKEEGRNYSYSSPLRPGDNDPSFKVHAKDNVWIDFGNGSSGNIFDFGIRHFGSTGEFLKELRKHYPKIFLDDSPSNQTTTKDVKQKQDQQKKKEEPEIKIKRVRPLFSYPLLKYINERRIPQVIADKFCKEVTYELKGKEFYAIGFKNNSGGYALRNRYMKQASVPNDATFIDNRCKSVAVFEGFFDFLSYIVLYHNQGEPNRNFLILNSTSFFEKYLSKMQEHEQVHLFVDNDTTGNDCTILAQGLLGDKIVDRRSLYKDYHDLNELHQSFGLKEKPRLNQKL